MTLVLVLRWARECKGDYITAATRALRRGRLHAVFSRESRGRARGCSSQPRQQGALPGL